MSKAKFLVPILFLFLLIPAMVFAGSFTDKVKLDVIPVISTIFSVLLGGGLIAKIRTVGKVKKAIKEVGDVVAHLQVSSKDPGLKKEIGEALGAMADVLLDIGLKVEAEKLRKAAAK